MSDPLTSLEFSQLKKCVRCLFTRRLPERKRLDAFEEALKIISSWTTADPTNTGERSQLCGIFSIRRGYIVHSHNLASLFGWCKQYVNRMFTNLQYKTVEMTVAEAGLLAHHIGTQTSHSQQAWTVRKHVPVDSIFGPEAMEWNEDFIAMQANHELVN